MGRSPAAPPAQLPALSPNQDDLNLLRAYLEPVSTKRVTRAVAGSLAFHAAAALLFWIAPEVQPYRVPRGITPEDLRKSAVLILPKDLLQGPVPSPGSSAGSERQAAAASPRKEPLRFRPPSLAPGQPAATPAPMIQAPVLEAPPDTVSAPPSIAGIGAPAILPPPAPKPRATFEPVGGPPAPSSGSKQPATPAEEALRAALRSSGVVQIPSDTAQDTSGLPELRSDPEGVDFTQYFAQARTKVKRNWLMVIPDAALRGRRGVVKVDFAIDRRGLVYGLKIISPSGVQAFDLAAVGAITASSPFAVLPAAFKKDHIDLTWTFTYTTTQR